MVVCDLWSVVMVMVVAVVVVVVRGVSNPYWRQFRLAFVVHGCAPKNNLQPLMMCWASECFSSASSVALSFVFPLGPAGRELSGRWQGQITSLSLKVDPCFR